MFKLIREIDTRNPLNLAEVKKYYLKEVPRLEELYAAETSLQNLMSFHWIYVFLDIDSPSTCRLF